MFYMYNHILQLAVSFFYLVDGVEVKGNYLMLSER